MWILLSILVALGSLFGYHETLAAERLHYAATHSAGAELPKVRPQSGSGPVGSIKV